MPADAARRHLKTVTDEEAGNRRHLLAVIEDGDAAPLPGRDSIFPVSYTHLTLPTKA